MWPVTLDEVIVICEEVTFFFFWQQATECGWWHLKLVSFAVSSCGPNLEYEVAQSFWTFGINRNT